jgi:aminopeptidase N
MKNRFFAALLLVFSLAAALADTDTDALTCTKSASFLAPTNAEGERNYAPDRDVQVIHLALDLTPDFKRRTIRGSVTLRFKPLILPVRELKLDAVELNIASVTATERIESWQVTDKHVTVTFTHPIAPDQETTVTIAYSAEPTRGIYFRTPEMGYKPEDTHLFSQGESIDARHWYPCLDSPNQRFTSEVTCHVPEGMTVISNGRLVSEAKDPATGLVAFHWSQEKPHSSYLISLVAGSLKCVQDTVHGLPLAFYTPASEIAEAPNSFHDTKDMIQFFEDEIGVPYPWPKYYQVCVNDFVEGGMENTSATTLTDRTLFTPATEDIRESDGLMAHELAHQWFGDLVTCKDWSHIWLNEGFATFYETLYDEHRYGRDNMIYELYSRARQITSLVNDTTPIVRRTYASPDDMFGYLVYPKAGWVLHMLRAQLGKDLYRRCIKTYLERHQYGNVVTEDLRAVIEELSGRSYDQFFDQWLYHGRFPDLDIAYTWDESSKLARLNIRQTQEVNDKVLLFNFPLKVRFDGKPGVSDHTIQITKKQEDFYFPLPAAPRLVRIDPDYTLLAKIKFPISRPMLYVQLADERDVAGRLLAIEQLAAGHDHDAVRHLQHTLNHDPFYGVRLEAAKALRGMHTDEALAALLASTPQPDARVRRQVVEALGGFYDDKAFAAALRVVDHERNPDILAVALRQMGGYAKPEVRPLLLKYLNSDSYRNELAVAAIAAVRSQDDPAYIDPLMDTLARREADFTSRGFAQGLQALAYLARNQEKKDSVREFLLARVHHKKRIVQLAALSALGALGDARAIAVVATFADASDTTPQQATAQRALTQLRADRKPVDDFKNLRQEVLDLEKANRDLRQQFDEFKTRFEAAPALSAAKKGRGSPAAPKRKLEASKPGLQTPKVED